VKIIANALVITCDQQNRGGRYSLLVRDGRIAEIAESPDILSALHPQASVVDATNKLVIPGFVNAHFHTESILLQPRTDTLHFSLWHSDRQIQESTAALRQEENIDDLRNVYLMSYFRHLKSGTTCVGEFGPPVHGDSFASVLQCIERTEVKSVISLQTWDQIARAATITGGHHRFLVNIGREEDFTVYSFENQLRAAREANVPLLAHLGEQRSDAENVKKTFQKNILSVVHDFTAIRPDTVFVHLNHMTREEIALLSMADASAVICARSAAYKRTGYPALRFLAQERIRLAVGTDWARTDMLEELKFLHQLHLLIAGIPRFTPLQLVRMGTINGAHTLGLASEIGSIEPGKKADLTFFSLDDMRLPVIPDNPGTEELAELLVHHLSTRDVTEVMVDGEFYISNGTVMTLAEEEIVSRFRSTVEKITGGKERERPELPSSDLDATQPRIAPKILPFSQPGRRTEQVEEGYVTGFSAQESEHRHETEQKTTEKPVPTIVSPLRVPKPQVEQKTTWLTFGDDEEF
jgi:5-methylthioadenosine/S-adenosylhomocysteine deaminase